MQDLKHLSQKKTSLKTALFGNAGQNRRITTVDESLRQKIPLPSGKKLQHLKLTTLFIAILIVLAPVSFYLLKKVDSSNLNLSSYFTPFTHSTPSAAEAAKSPAKPSQFQIANELLPLAEISGSRISAKTVDGFQHIYTIQGDLQQRVHGFLEKNHVPYGVFVAIEPTSGRILGMTAYSSVDPNWAKRSAFELYPMASLFKIITASAALESHKITPESVIEFRGRAYSENPRYWDIAPRGRNNKLDVTYAMGKSINPVYGRVASEVAGKTAIMESVSRFGFNQALLPGIPAKPSQAREPIDTHGLRLMGAGLDHEVKISPLHAAVIISAIANGGTMMMPSLTSSIIGEGGVIKEAFAPQELRRLVTSETSASLTQMLSNTVLTGTSRKAFHDKRGRLLLNVSVAAKTGSIDGTDPKGHYSWFAGFAPIQNPKIALVALVINPDKWKIKASQVGEQALEEFFKR